MNKVIVKTKTCEYDVQIGASLIGNLKSILDEIVTKPYDQVFFVSDTNVWECHGDAATGSFDDPHCFVFDAGEQSKNPITLVKCLETMVEAGCTRDSIVVTLGGGVACDLGGFAAATFMRGIRVLQVPTSLLAMVDASVGGKTAVDLKGGKNLFGAFHQPVGVIIDVDTLATLDDSQFTDSVGEIVKHAVLADPEMFNWLSNNKLDKSFVGTEELTKIITRNVEIKRDIVNADEKEAGVRQTLNLGHTIGHAIEAASDYKLGHGSCVAAGLCTLCKTSLVDAELGKQIISAFEKQGLPTSTQIPSSKLIELIKADKKRHGETVNFVVPKSIGKCEVETLTFDQIEHLLA